MLIARVLDTLITFAQQPSGPQLDSLSCVTVLEPTLSLLNTEYSPCVVFSAVKDPTHRSNEKWFRRRKAIKNRYSEM